MNDMPDVDDCIAYSVSIMDRNYPHLKPRSPEWYARVRANYLNCKEGDLRGFYHFYYVVWQAEKERRRQLQGDSE